MQKKIILWLSILLASFRVNCQDELFFYDINVSQLNEPTLFGEIQYQQVITAGSQFLFNEWVKGDVELFNGRIARNVNLKYNGYTDELIWLNPANKTVLLDKNAVVRFTITSPINGEKITFKNQKVKVPYFTQPVNTFLQEMYIGDYKLYVFRQVVQSGRQINTDKNRTYEVPEVKPKPLYYIQQPDGQWVMFLKPKRSVFSNLNPSKKVEIKKQLSLSRIRFRSEQDIIDVIEIVEEVTR